uniref:Secreted protein n=1 Tax=Steinernema glaseri TaxID=37863 RepID=A0A1I8AD78_9BILA
MAVQGIFTAKVLHHITCLLFTLCARVAPAVFHFFIKLLSFKSMNLVLISHRILRNGIDPFITYVLCIHITPQHSF